MKSIFAGLLDAIKKGWLVYVGFVSESWHSEETDEEWWDRQW